MNHSTTQNKPFRKAIVCWSIFFCLLIVGTSCSINYKSYGKNTPRKAAKKIYHVNKRNINAKKYGVQDQMIDCPRGFLFFKKKGKKPMTSYDMRN